MITKGVVTAAYPTGGFNGYYLQTARHRRRPSTWRPTTRPTPSSCSPARRPYAVQVGDYLQVTGKVSEFAGMTELTPAAGGVTTLTDPATAPAPATVGFPATDAGRESLEGMLVAPQGAYTVTDNYTLNQYAEIGLAPARRRCRSRPTSPKPRRRPHRRPSRPTTPPGRSPSTTASSVNYLHTGKDTPLPYLTPDTPDPGRCAGARSPSRSCSTTATARGSSSRPAADRRERRHRAAGHVPDTRTGRAGAGRRRPQDRQLQRAELLPETGADFVADGGTCSCYNDRAGNQVTVNTCDGNGPRGAADDDEPARQRAKIVAAINTLGADVLSLEEIENSAQYGGPDRDDALSSLVDALNAAAGAGTSGRSCPRRPPADRPAVADEDVIRTAFIYKQAEVEPVGTSHILAGPAAFDNAREPLAQAFRPAGGAAAQDFLVIVNHFKSKGSGAPTTAPARATPTRPRVAQAKALVTFADQQKARRHRQVFLTGDFNSYTQEDPLQVLYDAGYTDIGSDQAPERVHLPVRRRRRLARPRARQRRGARHGHRRARVEHQLGRVGGLRVQPLQLQRDRLLRPEPVPLQRPRPAARRLHVPAPPAATTTTATTAPREPGVCSPATVIVTVRSRRESAMPARSRCTTGRPCSVPATSSDGTAAVTVRSRGWAGTP